MTDKQNKKPRPGNMVLRLVRTTSFRFTTITVGLFMISVILLSGFVYQATIGAAVENIEERLVTELEDLQKIYALTGFRGLRGTISARSSRSNKMIVSPYSDDSLYVFHDPLDRDPYEKSPRDLTEFPEKSLRTNDIIEFQYEREKRNALQLPESERYEERHAIGGIQRFYDPNTGRLDAIVFVAKDITSYVELRDSARGIIYRMALVTFLMAVILAFFSSRAFLNRIDRVNRTTEAIRAGDLSKRVALTGVGDEFDSLSMNLNAMLDQIERLMQGMRQVSDNIAHDLRSPLTRIKARIERALSDPQSDKKEVLEETGEEVDRLLATFNALLSITRIEAGETLRGRQLINMRELVEEVAELYEPAAQDAGFELVMDLKDSERITGSRELISQALANLLDNAFKYAQPPENCDIQPRIEVRTGPRQGGGAFLTVADNGQGVPEAERERILQRFVRLEQSRSTQGSGLGLSMVSAIARAHDARLSVSTGLEKPAGAYPKSVPDYGGLSVRLGFPPAAKTKDAEADQQKKPA